MSALALPQRNTDWGSYPQHTNTGILAHALANGGRAAMQAHEQSLFENDLDRYLAKALAKH